MVEVKRDVLRRDRDRLQRWLRKWRQERFLYDMEGKLVGLADANSLPAEIDAALRGDVPPRRGERRN